MEFYWIHGQLCIYVHDSLDPVRKNKKVSNIYGNFNINFSFPSYLNFFIPSFFFFFQL